MSFANVSASYSSYSNFSSTFRVSAHSSPSPPFMRWRCTCAFIFEALMPSVQCAAVMTHSASMSEAPHT